MGEGDQPVAPTGGGREPSPPLSPSPLGPLRERGREEQRQTLALKRQRLPLVQYCGEEGETEECTHAKAQVRTAGLVLRGREGIPDGGVGVGRFAKRPYGGRGRE